MRFRGLRRFGTFVLCVVLLGSSLAFAAGRAYRSMHGSGYGGYPASVPNNAPLSNLYSAPASTPAAQPTPSQSTVTVWVTHTAAPAGG